MGFQNRLKPKRSLGQNFFNNKSLANHIVNIVLQSNPRHITEIGPGKGSFTGIFYVATKDMLLIEKDYELSNELKALYNDNKILNEDFLDYNLDIFDTTFFGSLPYKLVGILRIVNSFPPNASTSKPILSNTDL